ncbi:UDP-N-acetylglucosamine 1-carboxyvinyltransferase [Candidatus Margulisiibacteriota bacterium]
MSSVVIRGGVRLKGKVRVSGSKNAALPILAATAMMEGETVLSNVPHLTDIVTMIRLLRALNLKAEQRGDRVGIRSNGGIKHMAPYELITKMRASFFVAGPILAKNGYAKIPLPGGCAIGSRPVGIHLKGFEALGADITIEHGFVEIKGKKLKGNKVILEFPSVGATENIMMAATLAKGETVIENAAQEPEIESLAHFLNKAGAWIEGAGTDEIHIQGADRLEGIQHSIVSDRIEAGTLMIAAAITKGDVEFEGIVVDHLEFVIDKLQSIGVKVEDKGDGIIRVSGNGNYRSVDLKTSPYPGFPTDMQAQFMALLSLSQGTSIISEMIFENRFMHASELGRMGADITIKDHNAIVKGVRKLSGAPVIAPDLRAGAALWLAALAADGVSHVSGNEHVERGYEDFAKKLRSLGARIERVKETVESA